MHLTRRRTLELAAAATASMALPAGSARAAEDWTETHGLSTFGDLALPADFKYFAYVNPNAPKGGTLRLQIRAGSGNQDFETFDTLNIFVLRGSGAAGMDATFDTLMSGTADEPGSLYGLVARSVRISADKLTYRFALRPEARFSDGSRVTAGDAAFSFNILKEKGHPVYRSILRDFAGASADGDDTLVVKFVPGRNRDIHLVVGGLPIFSQAWWKGRDFEG
ncbi:MAG: hypothetical protein JWO28_985 [Hyphomicrobiales bacterium]|nr:hypothetical protein [Hyphomicrobiales bacterium]